MEEKMKSTMDEMDNRDIITMLRQVSVMERIGAGLMLYSDEDFEVILSYLRIDDAEKLKANLSDEVVFNYRTHNGMPLKGLLMYGDEQIEVDFKNLPEDHMIPEVIDAQKNFVVYRTIMGSRKKLFMVANRKIMKNNIKKMPLGELRRMSQLIDALLAGIPKEALEEYDTDASAWYKMKHRVEAALEKKA